jgi:hypothetical protein
MRTHELIAIRPPTLASFEEVEGGRESSHVRASDRTSTISTMFAHCPSDRLCCDCRENDLGFLRGTASCRGSVWASKVSEQTHRRDPWPAYDGRCRTIALRKVRDLTSDEPLREMLARIVHESAVRSWRT